MPRRPCSVSSAEASVTDVGSDTKTVWLRAIAYSNSSEKCVTSDMKAFEYRLRSPLAQWWTTLPEYLRQYEDLLKQHGYDTLDKVWASIA